MDNQTYYGRGPNITPQARRVIAEVYVLDHAQTAKEVMREVHKRLGASQRRPGWPGESAISKELTRLRKKDNERESDPLNMPFSLGAVFDQNIPAEAIPMLVEIQYISPMTLRQARWVAKLYIAAHKYDYASIGDEPTLLYNLAATYALREEACELTGESCDTSDLDKLYLMDPSNRNMEETLKLGRSTTRKAFDFLKQQRKVDKEAQQK